MAKSDFRATAISGSLTKLIDGTSYLIGGSDINITTGSNGAVTIAGTGGGGSSEWTRSSTLLYPNTPVSTTVLVGGTSPAGADIILGAAGSAVFNEGGGSQDFRVETAARENALLIKGASNQVLVLSGGDASSSDEASGGDVAFYVSGSIGSRGSSSERGVSLFGGDVVHSGSVTILDPGGSDENLRLVRGPSGNNYIVFEDSDGTDRGQIYSNGVHLFLRANTNDLIFRAGTKNVLRMQGSTERVGIGNDLASPSHMLHVSGTQSEAFRVDTGDKENAILAQGERVLILSGGAPSSPPENEYPDVNFFVSGTVGSRGANNKGTALFGGDVVISGTLYGGSPLNVGESLNVNGTNPAVQFYESGVEKALIGVNSSENIIIENKVANKHIVFKISDAGIVREGLRVDGAVSEVVINQGSESLVDFRVESDNKERAIFVDGSADQVLILSGGSPASPPENEYPDINFFVSGTIGSRETAVRGTSLFGGDVNISGSLVVGENRQSVGHGLEVSGSSRAGAGTSGRLEYIYGSFDYQLENSQPRFLPLAKSFEIHDIIGNKGERGTMMEFINPPHDGVIKEVRLALSGANGNNNNPGNSQIAFYSATTSTPNLHLINQVGSSLSFAAAPTGFVRDITGTNNITNDDGQTWVFTWANEPMISKDRLFGLAVGFTLGCTSTAAYHCTYTVVMEYNEFT